MNLDQNHQWSFVWYVIVLWRINFKCIPSLEGHWCRRGCFSCLVAGTKQSSGDGGCTVPTIVLCQLSPTKKHLMPSNPFELVVVLFFHSSAMLDEIKSFEQPFETLILSTSDDLQFMTKNYFWWSCFWWGISDDVITSGALVFRTSFLHMLQTFFLMISLHSFVLSNPMLKKWTLHFCLWSCTLEQILAYPIDNFFNTLLSSKLKGNVKHILFQHSLQKSRNHMQSF